MKMPSRKKYALTIVSIIAGLVLLLALYLVFTGKWILPQQFSLGPVTIRFYGVCLALAAVIAYAVVMRRRSAYDINQQQSDAIILFLLVSGFVGARLYHVVSELPYYLEHFALIPAVWKGGLSIFGAIIGGVVGLGVYLKFIARQKQFSLKELSNILDWLVPGVAIGQAIGRFGNLFNYEIYGYPTDLPWKMFVPARFRLPPYETSQFFHPLFLYESIISLIIALALIKLSPKLRGGSLFFLWLFLYNGMRFFLETMRFDSVLISGFKLSEIVAGVLVIVGLIGFRKLQRPIAK